MEAELQEIKDFLAQHVLFEELDDAMLSKCVRAISIKYLRRGQVFPPETGTEPGLLIIRTGAIEIRDKRGQLLEKLAENDNYLDQCTESEIDSTGYVSEDCLIYSIPCHVIEKIRIESKQFDHNFTTVVEQRLRHAIERFHNTSGTQSAINYFVRDLLDRAPVLIQHNQTITHAAKVMTAENVSSALIVKNEKLVGMVTDRDLRSRFIAQELSGEQPVSNIMSSELITADEHTILSEALLLMTKNHIQHLPVVKHNEPIGNLSVSDVIRHLSTNSAFIATDIEKANSTDALVKISQRLPELHLQLVSSNSSAAQIGEIFSMITDSITCRLLQLGEEKFGAAPVNYVWLAGGSQGRNEQTSHSDQDNCMFIDDSMSESDDEYFKTLSKYVSDGLNACGYVYCPGNAMATNDQWRQKASVWTEYFTSWIERPEKKSLMLASIFFDLRPVYGNNELFENVQSNMLAEAKKNGIFQAHMVSNALTHRPPLGFFRNFVLIHDQEHANTLDVKHQGIVPIIDIARIYALAEGFSAVNTRQRLKLAFESGSMSREMSENLVDAFDYISTLRNEHQVNLIKHGKQADNFLDPDSLSGLERGHLKDAFSIIKTMQEVLEHRYQTGRLL